MNFTAAEKDGANLTNIDEILSQTALSAVSGNHFGSINPKTINDFYTELRQIHNLVSCQVVTKWFKIQLESVCGHGLKKTTFHCDELPFVLDCLLAKYLINPLMDVNLQLI